MVLLDAVHIFKLLTNPLFEFTFRVQPVLRFAESKHFVALPLPRSRLFQPLSLRSLRAASHPPSHAANAHFRTNYLAEVHGLIYVVDSSTLDRMEECRRTLHQLLTDRRVNGKPVLMLVPDTRYARKSTSNSR